MTTTPFFDRLETVRRERSSVLCVGIDPRLERIPASFHESAGGSVERLLTNFGLAVLDQAGPYAACFKPQIAFFEQHGLAGLRAYATVVREARRRGLLVIGDTKRGDIGSTAEAYAQAHLVPGGDFEVDALTINPYLGADALAPFVEAAAAHGKGLYVLVRTSNPGARDLQELDAGGDRLFEKTADLVVELGAPHVSDATGLSLVGAVVGATSPEAGARLRARMPDTPFLVPGYGAQGATAEDVAVCFRRNGSGAVVNASRSINHPPMPDGDWAYAVSGAAKAAQEELYAACCPGRPRAKAPAPRRSPAAEATKAPWYVTAFDERYLRIYAHRDAEEATRRAPGIVKLLGLKPGDRLLDVGCGEGRYARALAMRGIRVTGLDLSPDLLQEARERSGNLPGAPLYVERDMRRLPYTNQFEGVISMFTSFGYFSSQTEDLAVLEGVARALVPGGRFVMDFMNAAHVRSTLVPEEVRELGNLRVEIQRRIVEDAPGGPRVEKHVRALAARSGVVEFESDESVRLYTPEELDALFTRAGLTPIGEPLADTDGAAFDAMADRLVRVAEKRVG